MAESFSSSGHSAFKLVLSTLTCISLSLAASTQLASSEQHEENFTSGSKVSQVYFGDSEGNPAGWPQPIFHDGFTPWMKIASDYDSVVFDPEPNALGDVVYASTPSWRNVNFPRGVEGFGLDAYFGRTRPLPADGRQALVTLGALLGGTFAGIDYAAPRDPRLPPNLVRLAKKFFSADVGAGVFLNSVRARGGKDWWYDIYPNILACGLAVLYRDRADSPGEPKLFDLCEESIDTWRRAVDQLRGDEALPEFAYKAVQLVDGPVAGAPSLTAEKFTPIGACDTGQPGYQTIHVTHRHDPRQVCFGFPKHNGDVFESDAAGGLAYLGLLGYETTGRAEDRRLAELSLDFLDRADYNTLYENLLPYGALAAVRFNAEYGDKHNAHKLLGDLFATSDVRARWGMVGKNWGGHPAYGLVGSRKTGLDVADPIGPDYAFAFNTMDFAATLAPIPRYDPATANAIGKYLCHVAHNARYFYPAYLTYMDAQTEAYIRMSGDAKLNTGLPFEGVKSKFPGQIENDMFGTGDALKANRAGAYRTDLGVYSGVYAGAMAKIFTPTVIDDIYQIDLVGTDIPAPAAYPSLLVYNPYDDARAVPLRIDVIRRSHGRLQSGDFLLYDAVNKAVVARHIGSSATVTVTAHEGIVLVAVPESDGLEVVGNHVIAKESGFVVDYNWSAK